MSNLIVNALNQVAQRMNFLSQFSGSGLDAKRSNAWASYGYPDVISFGDYMKAYKRSGAGNGAIHKLLGKCWEECPKVHEGDEADDSRERTRFEIEVENLFNDKRLLTLQRLIDFDRRNMAARYSALIYQVADGMQWDKPLKKTTVVSDKRLVRLIPAYEGQIRVATWNNDRASTQYGQPSMYQFRTRGDYLTDTQGQPEEWIDVHPDRIQILAEGSSYGMFEGEPLLQAGFNSLIDLEKVQGGSGEAYLKNSSRQLSIEFDKEADVPQAVRSGSDDGEQESVRDAFNERITALNTSIDSALVTQGAKVQTLQSQMSDPESPWQIAANSFAASVQIPFTILFGQMTGRLASDEDKKDFAKRAKSRQLLVLTPMLYEFITRMMYIGQISTVSNFVIEWPDLLASSDTEKLDNGLKLANMNKVGADAGMGLLYDENEIRAASGYDAKESYEMPERLDEKESMIPDEV